MIYRIPIKIITEFSFYVIEIIVYINKKYSSSGKPMLIGIRNYWILSKKNSEFREN